MADKSGATSTEISCISSSGYVTTSLTPSSAICSPVRIILASLDECNVLLRDGLDFYGATFFPTEPALSTSIAQVGGKKTVTHNSRLLDLMSTSGIRVRDILPMFDCSAFSKIPTPVTKTIHNRG